MFLRLRKAALQHRTRVVVDRAVRLARAAQDGRPRWCRPRPGDEAAALEQLASHGEFGARRHRRDPRRRAPGDRRPARSPRPPSWPAPPVPGWPGCRAGPATAGRVEAGCLPNAAARRPSGRRRRGPRRRRHRAGASTRLPEAAGRDADRIVAALRAGELGGLVIGGVDPDDTADPAATRAALEAASFVVALELRETDVTRAADVVFPVAPVTDKAGTFVTWEGRPRPFDGGLQRPAVAARPAGPRRHRRGARAARSRPRSASAPSPRRAPQMRGPRPLGRRPRRHGRRGGPGAGRTPPDRRRASRLRHLEADDRRRLDAGRRRAPAGHRPPAGRPGQPRDVRRARRRRHRAAGERRRSPVTAARSRCRSWSPTTSSTAWSGCPANSSAAACWPTWPRPARRSP